jgi:hypothetical protein
MPAKRRGRSPPPSAPPGAPRERCRPRRSRCAARRRRVQLPFQMPASLKNFTAPG